MVIDALDIFVYENYLLLVNGAGSIAAAGPSSSKFRGSQTWKQVNPG
jgi:hypothetical protein